MRFPRLILCSIPLKICLSILCIEALLLTIVGIYYTNRFSVEIDEAVLQKVLLPAHLMSGRALNFDAVQDRAVISELLQEEVIKTFIVNIEGKVHYADDPQLEGVAYDELFSIQEKSQFLSDFSSVQTLFFSDEGGDCLAVLAPITSKERLLGAIYIKVNAQKISEKKQAIGKLFLVGAMATIVLTTILEFLWVYKIIVPRVNKTSEALKLYENYDFSYRLQESESMDQLGILMRQVNQMAERLEKYASELYEAETKYREIFVNSSDGIYRTTLEGKFLEVNPAIATLAGYDSVEDFLEHVTDVGTQIYSRPEDRQLVLEKLFRGESIQDYELPMKRRDGSIAAVSLSVQLALDQDGNAKHLDGRVVDITEKKNHERVLRQQQSAEAAAKVKSEMVVSLEKKNQQLQEALEELRNTQRQLLQSEKMAVLGMTAGGVAHDLNNILSALISYPELLLISLPQDSSLRPTIEAILASGKRAAAIVADLLTLSHGVATERKNVSLNALVEEYTDSLEYDKLIKDSPQVTVYKNLCKEPLIISCSAIHIQKVIMNLIMNAMEASKSGGTVTISTNQDKKSTIPNKRYNYGECLVDTYGVLKVTDDGVGISFQDLKNIFEPFYTRKMMGKTGTGLGLTIVNNVVREHNGTVEAVSADGKTTFTIRLPLQEDIVPKEKAEALQSFEGKGAVLVIDDEPVQRDLGYRILSSLGYSVSTVASGEEAVPYLIENRVDILVLDMIMAPGISGLETYKRILENHPQQKAVIVSGFSMNKDVAEALSLGPSKFLQKPYTRNQIGKTIKDVLSCCATG